MLRLLATEVGGWRWRIDMPCEKTGNSFSAPQEQAIQCVFSTELVRGVEKNFIEQCSTAQ